VFKSHEFSAGAEISSSVASRISSIRFVHFEETAGEICCSGAKFIIITILEDPIMVADGNEKM